MPPTPHPLPWASGWFDMVINDLLLRLPVAIKKAELGAKNLNEVVSETEGSVTREELEDLFAYELRVANADILKLKVYDRGLRYTPHSDLPEMKR